MPRHPSVRRRPSTWRRLDALSRLAFPAGMLVFGLFLLGLPFGIPGQAEFRPAYAMACVFFWSLYRPQSMPAPIIAIIGVLLDLMGLTPIGLWAILLLILHGITVASRRRLVPKSFLVNWGGVYRPGGGALMPGLAGGNRSHHAHPATAAIGRANRDCIGGLPGTGRVFHPCASRRGSGGTGVRVEKKELLFLKKKKQKNFCSASRRVGPAGADNK